MESREATDFGPDTPTSELLDAVTRLTELVERRDEALRRADIEAAHLSSALAEARVRLDTAEAALRTARARHRREMAALRGSRWWKLGRFLRRPWRAITRAGR